MWKMFDTIECSDCGGYLGPPPKFLIPPPPRSPSMGSRSNCNEEEMALKAQQAWENDICEAMPIFDASLYSSQSLQTSAMIAVFSLLLVLVILLSSLFVWKNKRKVQNFLPCKTLTRGPHMNGGLPIVGAHSVTYEDPDAHLGHRRPLVMRHHHNVEVIHPKGIHYPSGYPMTRSPPFLVSSSPGPDPYRSTDNVYEELDPSRDSDGGSEGVLHSDDDFAEDELSLPGERSFSKAPTMPEVNAPATNYHERSTNIGGAPCPNGPERNSVLSSSSSSQDASTATPASSTSSHNNNNNHNNNVNSLALCASSSSRTYNTAGVFAGMLRQNTNRSKFHTTNGNSVNIEGRNATGVDAFHNTSTPTAGMSGLKPFQRLYDNRSNLMTLAYAPQHQQQSQLQHRTAHQPHGYHSLHSNHLKNNNHGGNVGSTAPQFYNILESEIERRNRINTQLRCTPAVSTIFRERNNYASSDRYQQPYYLSNTNNNLLENATRSRSNPRSIDRRQQIPTPIDLIEPAYACRDPMFHGSHNYESSDIPSMMQERFVCPPAYIMSASNSDHHYYHPGDGHQPYAYQQSTQIYARGDSSFGSDSGYSHHTPASSIGRHDYDLTLPMPSGCTAATTTTSTASKTPSRLAAALNFTSWNRRKANSSTPPQIQTMPSTRHIPPVANNDSEATSPNNNSASSTITSTLENSSASSGTTAASISTCASAATAHNNNSAVLQTQTAAST